MPTTLLRTWRDVLMADPCVYCGGPAAGLDHIVPKSAGGSDGWVNRAPACRGCDLMKGATPLLLLLVEHHRARVRLGVRTRYRGVAAYREGAIRSATSAACRQLLIFKR